MARDTSPEFVDAITAGTAYPVILSEGDFDDGTQYLWNGIGDLSYNGNTYLGAGQLLKVDPGTETSEIEAQNAAFELSGIAAEDISVALQENYQGRRCRILLGFFSGVDRRTTDDGSTRTTDEGEERTFDVELTEGLIEPIRLFSGRMDVMTIEDDPDAPFIRMTAESDMVRLNRSRDRRYTHEDQQIEYSGDQFFDQVVSLQDKQVVWG